MSTSVYPYLPPDELKKAEEESIARELAWLLNELQESLVSLKSGLEDCYALLAPIEPGSTLVLSSSRSESIKGHVTRVGSQVVKGSLHLRLKTHPPLHLRLSPEAPLPLPSLTHLRALLNQSLDAIDITRFTGDRTSATFISSQLRLLHSLLHEALSILKGPSLLPSPTPSPFPPATPEAPWYSSPLDPAHFSPPLPPHLSLHWSLQESSLVLTVRVLESTTMQPSLGSKFAFAIGAARRLEHDEMDEVFVYGDEKAGGKEEVRVKEKVRVESSTDPSLLSLMSKLGALERAVGGWREGLRVVSGEAEED